MTLDEILGHNYDSTYRTARSVDELLGRENALDGTLLGATTSNAYTNRRKRRIRKKLVARDEYGNTENEILREKARIAKSIGQSTNVAPDERYAGLGIPDSQATLTPTPVNPIEISDEYASRHRAERLGKINIVDNKPTGKVGSTQYLNPDPKVNRKDPTTWLGKQADYIDDKFDDVWEYIFGKPNYKSKKEAEEAFRADQNLQVNEDGNIVDSRQATLNEESLGTLRNELFNAPEDPDADQLIYYARVDNLDGTHSYKIGLAGVDTFGRTAEEDRGKDITYLWAKRTKDAAKYEALFHGNRELLKQRRNDIGMDPEGYGAGHTEIYNNDFLQLDGTVSKDKVHTLNVSTAAKLGELGLNISGRYDERGMRAGYKALDKARRIYGVNSKEAKELEYLMANMEQEGRQKQGLVEHAGDLVDAFQSGLQQTAAGAGDWVLDAVTPGNNSLLDHLKDPEVADEYWGYKGRDEAMAKGRIALRDLKQGNYVEAALGAIAAGPDLVAQSLPDMAEMAADVAIVLGTGGSGVAAVAAKRAARKALKNAIANGATDLTTRKAKNKFMRKYIKSAEGKKIVRDTIDARKDMGLMKKLVSGDTYRALGMTTVPGTAAWAARYTNNQIDERIQNNDGEPVDYGTIAGMYVGNYFSGLIEKAALGETVNSKLLKKLGSASERVQKNVVLNGIYKAVGLVEGGMVEAGQEYMQEYIEALNAGLGTKAYDYTTNIFHEEFQHRAELGAILGFGAGITQHGAIGGTKNVIGLGKERKRRRQMETTPDFFGNKFNDEENELNTEDKYPTEEAKYFKGIGHQGQNAEEAYEAFTKNLNENENPIDALNKIVDNSVDLTLTMGNETDVQNAYSNILNEALNKGDITEDQFNELSDKVNKNMEGFVEKLTKVFTTRNSTQAEESEILDKLDTIDPKNMNSMISTIALAAGNMQLDELEARVDNLLTLVDENSNAAEVLKKVNTLITAANTDTNNNNNTEEDDNESFSSARSKEVFDEIDKKEDLTEVEKTIAKAKAVVENSTARGKATTLENAIKQFNRLARGIAKTEGETNSKKIAKIAKDILTTYIHGDIKQISNDSTFKVLTKALFDESNIDAAGILGIFEALKGMDEKTLDGISEMQQQINDGYNASIAVQRNAHTDTSENDITTTAKGIYLNVNGEKSSLQSHLNNLLRRIKNPYITAADMARHKYLTGKSLQAFIDTKNTQNTNDTNTEEIDTLGESEKDILEAFKNNLMDAYDVAIERKKNPDIGKERDNKPDFKKTDENGGTYGDYVIEKDPANGWTIKLNGKEIAHSANEDINKAIERAEKHRLAEIKLKEESETKKTEEKKKKREEQKKKREEGATQEQLDENYEKVLEEHDDKRLSKKIQELLEEVQEEGIRSKDKLVNRLANKLSKFFNPAKILEKMGYDQDIHDKVMKLVETFKEKTYWNTEGAKKARYFMRENAKTVFRTAKYVVAAGISIDDTKVKLDSALIDGIFKDTDLEHIEDFSMMVAVIEDVIKNIKIPEGSIVTPETNPFLFFVLDENGKIPEAFQSVILKGFLEALENYNSNLSSVPEKVKVGNDTTKAEMAQEHMGLDVNEDLGVQGGISKNNFANYLAKAIKKELELAVTDLDIKTEVRNIDGSTRTLKDDVKKEASEEISKSLALFAVTGILASNEIIQESKLDNNSYIHFKTYDNQKVITPAVRSQVKGLHNAYPVLAGRDHLTVVDKPGLIFESYDLPEVQKRLDKTDDKLSDESKAHIENVRNTKWEASDMLVGMSKLGVKELFNLLGLDIKDIKPSYILNHTDITVDELYEEVTGKKPLGSLSNEEKTRTTEQKYADRMEARHMNTTYKLPTYEGQVLEKVMIVKAINAYSAAKGKTLYFDGSIGGNGRIYVQGLGLLSPQSSKFLRYLVTPEITSNTVIDVSDATNNIVLDEFKSQIAEALDDFVDMPKDQKKKIDYSNIEVAKTQFSKLKVPQQLLDAAIAITEGTLMEEDVFNLGNKKDNARILGEAIDLTDGSTLPALYAYAKYLQTSIDGTRYFTSSFTMGQDGKSSVVAHLAIMEAALDESWEFMLSTGTLTTFAKDILAKRHPELVSEITNAQTVEELNNLGIDIKDGYQKAMADFAEKAEEAIVAMNKLLGEDLVVLHRNSDTNAIERIEITKAGRNFAKDPQMTNVYGRQRKSSSEGVALQFVDGLRDRIVAFRNGKAKDENIGEDLEDGLNALYGALLKLYTSVGKKEAVKGFKSGELRDFIKLVKNTDTNTLEAVDEFLYTKVLRVAEQAIGDTMFSTMTETNAPLTKNAKILNLVGILSTATATLITETLHNANTGKDSDILISSKSFQDYIDASIDNIIYKFGVGQDISAIRKEADEGSLAVDNIPVPDLNGKAETSVTTVKNVRFKSVPNSGSPAVGSIHELDKETAAVLSDLGLMQVFDSIYTFPGARAHAGGLANLAFLMNTVVNGNRYAKALEHMKKLRDEFKTVSEDNLGELRLASLKTFNDLSKDLHIVSKVLDIDVKIDNIAKLLRSMDKVIQKLEQASKDQQKFMLEKKGQFEEVSQYATEGAVKLNSLGQAIGIKMNDGSIFYFDNAIDLYADNAELKKQFKTAMNDIVKDSGIFDKAYTNGDRVTIQEINKVLEGDVSQYIDDKYKSRILTYLDNKHFSNITAVKKAIAHMLLNIEELQDNPAITKKAIQALFPDMKNITYEAPTVQEAATQDLYSQILHNIQKEEEIIKEREAFLNAYQPMEPVIGEEGMELIYSQRFNYSDMPKKIAQKMIDFIKNMNDYVVLDLEYTFNVPGAPQTIMEMAAKLNGENGEIADIFYKPEVYPRFIDMLKKESSQQVYLEVFDGNQFKTELNKTKIKSEEDLADAIYTYLNDITDAGNIPVVAYNGYKADFPMLAQLAIRTGNTRLQHLLNSIDLVDPFIAAYYIKNTASGKGAHTQSEIYKTVVGEEVKGTAHLGKDDVMNLETMIEGIKKDESLETLEDRKTNKKPERKTETETTNKGEPKVEVVQQIENAEDLLSAMNISYSSAAAEDTFNNDGRVPPNANDPATEAVDNFVGVLTQETVGEHLQRLFTYDHVEPGQKNFLNRIFNELVEPFYGDLNEIAYDEQVGPDPASAHGRKKADPRHRASISLLRRAGGFGAAKQSSAEVFVHEHIHVMIDRLFNSEDVKNKHAEEFAFFRDIYEQAMKVATRSWIAKGTQEDFDTIFDGTAKGMKEFYAYALSDHIFAQHIEDELKNPIKKALPEIDTSTIMSTILSSINKMLHWLVVQLDSRKNMNAHELLVDMAASMNDIDARSKNIIATAINGVTDVMHDADIIVRQRIDAYTAGYDAATDGKNYTYDPTTVMGGFLQDILPSTKTLNKYHKLMTKANTNVSKARNDIITKVSELIIGTNSYGRPEIALEQDTMLYDIALKMDLKALYKLSDGTKKVYKVRDVMAMIRDLEESILKLEKEMDPRDIGKIRNAGEALFRRTVGDSTLNDSNLEIAEVNSFMKANGILITDESYANVDALMTLHALKSLKDSTIYNSYYKKFVTSFRDHKFVRALSNTLDMDTDIEGKIRDIQKNSRIDRHFTIKGNTHKVTNDNVRLVPRVMTKEQVRKAEMLDHELVDTVKLPGTDVEIGIYRIEGSSTQNRSSGLVEITDIEYSDVTTVRQLLSNAGVNDANIKRIMNKITVNQKDMYFSTIKGSKTTVTDVSFSVPAYLEDKYLDVDTRASTSLAHKRGAIETFIQAKKTNQEWIDLAEEDARINLLKHKDEFIWIGEGAKNKDHVNYFRVLPRYMKNEIKKRKALSNRKLEGMWIRKEALTMSLGAEGASMMDVLDDMGVTRKRINYVIKKVENFMPIVGHLFKNEIVSKVLDVVAGNLASNILLEMLKGRNNPIEVTRVMLKNMLEIKDINTTQSKMSRLRVSMRTYKGSPRELELQKDYDKLERKLKRSHLYYFIKEGFNDNFIDDINAKESRYMSKFEKKIYKLSQEHPHIRNAFDLLYMNDGTTAKAIFSDIFIISDIAAMATSDMLDKKYLEKEIKQDFNRYWKSTQDTRTSTEHKALMYKRYRAKALQVHEDNRFRLLQELTIAYGVVTGGKVVNYLDKMNPLPFYKYKLRIKRVFMHRLHNRSISTIAQLINQAMLDSTITGDTFGLETAQESLLDIMSASSFQVFDNAYEVLTPASVELVKDIYGMFVDAA